MDLNSPPEPGLKDLIEVCLSMGSKGVMQNTVFMKRRNMKVIIRVVYVDDRVVTGNDIDEIYQLKDFLKKDQGPRFIEIFC